MYIPNPKHDYECGCVECIAYMETNLQVDLDEWSYDVDFPVTVPSIRYSVGTATNSLTADTDRRLVDKNAVVLNPHSFGSVNPPDIRENVSETQRERIHDPTRKERRAEQEIERRANHETTRKEHARRALERPTKEHRAEQQRKRRALERAKRKGLEQRKIKTAQQKD